MTKLNLQRVQDAKKNPLALQLPSTTVWLATTLEMTTNGLRKDLRMRHEQGLKQIQRDEFILFGQDFSPLPDYPKEKSDGSRVPTQ